MVPPLCSWARFMFLDSSYVFDSSPISLVHPVRFWTYPYVRGYPSIFLRPFYVLRHSLMFSPPTPFARIFLLPFYVPQLFFMFSELPYILGPAVTMLLMILDPYVCSWTPLMFSNPLYVLGPSFILLVSPLCSWSFHYALAPSFMFLVSL